MFDRCAVATINAPFDVAHALAFSPNDLEAIDRNGSAEFRLAERRSGSAGN
jgi:hypothetical protein